MLVSPYKNIIQYSKIQVKPNQMNSDIRNILKMNLRKKVEKKCNKNGFIDEVYKIEQSEAMDMEPENLSGASNFMVTFHCRICIPVQNTQLVVQIKNLNQVLILAVNGPIMIFIPKDNIDLDTWDVYDNFMHKQKKEELKVGSFVKVEVLATRINQLDYQIKVIGSLVDFASESEIKNYFGSVVDTNQLDSIDSTNNVEESKEENQENDSLEGGFDDDDDFESDIFI